LKIVKREAVFIPLKDLTRPQVDRIQNDLTFHFYAEEKVCEACEWLSERPNDVCANCANFNGTTVLASKVVVGKGRYLKIPVGSSEATLRRFKDVVYVDKSPVHKIKPITFTGTLRPEQIGAVEVLFKMRRGGLEAPPRSGKTVIGTALACKVGEKTLILASQRDWLMGFRETFVGSKTQERMTDLDKSRIKLCKTFEDFVNTDICLATIQSFYSEDGQRLLRRIRDMFPIVISDEVHTGAAPKYAHILSRLNAKWFIGLSGTHDRKDGKYILIQHILGPVLHELKTKKLRPTIRLTRTGYTKSYKGSVPWDRIVTSLETDKGRLKVIAQQAIKDVASGHMLLIPCARVKPIRTLVKLINDLAGKTIAYEFTGSLPKAKRDLYIEKARQYKIKVLVGTQKILSVGINIPRASCLYETVLSSNLPNAKQRMARVLTLVPDKPNPIIRYFLDDLNVRRNCMRNEYFNCMKPVFNPIISDRDASLLKAYFNSGGRQDAPIDF